MTQEGIRAKKHQIKLRLTTAPRPPMLEMIGSMGQADVQIPGEGPRFS